jgi:hypothetical protein
MLFVPGRKAHLQTPASLFSGNSLHLLRSKKTKNKKKPTQAPKGKKVPAFKGKNTKHWPVSSYLMWWCTYTNFVSFSGPSGVDFTAGSALALGLRALTFRPFVHWLFGVFGAVARL